MLINLDYNQIKKKVFEKNLSIVPTKLFVTIVLGIFILSTKCINAFTKKQTVEIPIDSKILATCPTDMWQTGQAATSNTASTLCDLSICAHLGAWVFIIDDCCDAPTKE